MALGDTKDGLGDGVANVREGELQGERSVSQKVLGTIGAGDDAAAAVNRVGAGASASAIVNDAAAAVVLNTRHHTRTSVEYFD